MYAGVLDAGYAGCAWEDECSVVGGFPELRVDCEAAVLLRYPALSTRVPRDRYVYMYLWEVKSDDTGRNDRMRTNSSSLSLDSLST